MSNEDLTHNSSEKSKKKKGKIWNSMKSAMSTRDPSFRGTGKSKKSEKLDREFAGSGRPLNFEQQNQQFYGSGRPEGYNSLDNSNFGSAEEIRYGTPDLEPYYGSGRVITDNRSTPVEPDTQAILNEYYDFETDELARSSPISDQRKPKAREMPPSPKDMLGIDVDDNLVDEHIVFPEATYSGDDYESLMDTWRYPETPEEIRKTPPQPERSESVTPEPEAKVAYQYNESDKPWEPTMRPEVTSFLRNEEDFFEEEPPPKKSWWDCCGLFTTRKKQTHNEKIYQANTNYGAVF